MFQNAQELMDALDGLYGEEAEEDALDFAEDTGLLDQWEAEDAGAADDGGVADEEYVGKFGAELLRLEKSIGRQLTQTEVNALIEQISPQELSEGTVPDLVTEVGEMLADFPHTEQGRLHLGASAVQEVFDEQAAREGRPPEIHDQAVVTSAQRLYGDEATPPGGQEGQ